MIKKLSVLVPKSLGMHWVATVFLIKNRVVSILERVLVCCIIADIRRMALCLDLCFGLGSLGLDAYLWKVYNLGIWELGLDCRRRG